MKRENIKLIIGIVIGVLFTSISVYAINVKSSNVTFTPEDETWDVESVEDALNDLNEMASKTKLYYLGTGSSYNIKNLYPDIDYTKLTIDNFIIGMTYIPAVNISASSGQSFLNIYSNAISISKSYNSSTGVLSISASGKTGGNNIPYSIYASKDISVSNFIVYMFIE